MKNWIVGELPGTFLPVVFGCGRVAAAAVTGARVASFQFATVWGIGIFLAIYLAAPLSGAYLNPAVSIALALLGGFPKSRIPGYIPVQASGAFIAPRFTHARLYKEPADARSAGNLPPWD